MFDLRDIILTVDSDGNLPIYHAIQCNASKEVIVMLIEVGGFESVLERNKFGLCLIQYVSDNKLAADTIVNIGVAMIVASNQWKPFFKSFLDEIAKLGSPYNQIASALQQGDFPVSLVNLHISGNQLAGKSMLVQWLQEILQARVSGLKKMWSYVIPNRKALIDIKDRTLGLKIHSVFRKIGDRKIEYVIHDYGGQAEFRMNHANFLHVGTSLYVIVLPLVEKKEDDEHYKRAYSLEELEEQYDSWLKQINSCILRADDQQVDRSSSLPIVVTVINLFKGLMPPKNLVSHEDLGRLVEQRKVRFAAYLDLQDAIFVDAKEESDCLEFVSRVRPFVKDNFETKRQVSIQLYGQMDSWLQKISESKKIMLLVKFATSIRSKLSDLYCKHDMSKDVKTLLVDRLYQVCYQRWINKRMIAILRRSTTNAEWVILSVPFLANEVFGKVIDSMRKSMQPIITKTTVLSILRDFQQGLDPCDLLVQLGLFLPVAEYDTSTGQTQLQNDSMNRDQKYLVIGQIKNKLTVPLSISKPDTMTHRRIHRFYSPTNLNVFRLVDGFYMRLFTKLLSMEPYCFNPTIRGNFLKMEIRRMEPAPSTKTYIVQEKEIDNLLGFEIIIDLRLESHSARKQSIEKDEVVISLLEINDFFSKECQNLILGDTLIEYCLNPENGDDAPVRFDEVERLWESNDPQMRLNVIPYYKGIFPQETQQSLLHKIEEDLRQLTTKVDNIADGLHSAVIEIRSTFENNSEQLKEMRKKWKEEVDQLEISMRNYMVRHKIVTVSTASAAAVTVDDHQQAIVAEIERMFQTHDARLLSAMEGKLQAVKKDLVSSLHTKDTDQYERVVHELRKVQAQLVDVLKISQETNNELKNGLQILRKTIIQLKERTFPTTFILIDQEMLQREQEEEERKRKEEAAANNHANQETSRAKQLMMIGKCVFNRMNTLLDAVSNPTETLVNAINQALREEEYVALVCEVCRLPQKTTDGEPGYKISKPKEIVGKILPLAKVGMQVAFLVNKVSSVGRVFGLPTPVLQDSTMSAASSFLNDLGQESLDSFPSLQQKVQECYENNKNTTDSELSEQDDSTLLCARVWTISQKNGSRRYLVQSFTQSDCRWRSCICLSNLLFRIQ